MFSLVSDAHPRVPWGLCSKVFAGAGVGENEVLLGRNEIILACAGCQRTMLILTRGCWESTVFLESNLIVRIRNPETVPYSICPNQFSF